MKRIAGFPARGLALAAAALALCAAEPALADVTFGASVTNANGTLNTTVTWSTNPVATSCTASGHPSWTGTKAASGSQALPAISMSGTYTLTLSCQRAGDSTLTFTWVPPTTNTDGSPYTNPAGYRIYWNTGGENAVGNAPASQRRDITTVATTQAVVTGVAPGDWYGGVVAINTNGVESDLATRNAQGVPQHKVITGAIVEQASVTLTVNPKPSAASVGMQ